MEEVSLLIDGKPVQAEAGTTVWEAARRSGIRIPTLCHHPDLKPAGACRICLVEDESSGRMLASCVTPVAKDMIISTDSESVIRHRRNIVRLLMANHSESCVVCDQGNACRLREIAAELGIGPTGLYPMKRYHQVELANPFITRDLSKCILCGRCIRADHELVVVGAIDYHFRGFDALPSTLHEEPLEHSNCTFCGTCVSMCPTGALRPKNQGHAGSPEKWTSSVCGFCGIGCALELGTAGGVLVDVEPSGGPGTPNRSTLCVRGHFEQDYVNAVERLREPTLGRDEERRVVDWEKALEAAAAGLKRTRDHYGPQSIAFLGSARCSIEENFLFQKIARALIGTNNVLSGLPGWEAILSEDSGAGFVTPGTGVTLEDVEEAEAIVVAGADPTESVPVLGYAVKRAARWKGTPIVVLDPRKTDLVKFSKVWIQVRPGSDSEVLDALAALLVKLGREIGPTVADNGSPGFHEYLKALEALNVDLLEEKNSIPAGSLERASRVLAGRKTVFVVGHGILEQGNAPGALRSLRDLARLTGRGHAAGSSVFLISRENNRMGALDMGSSPAMLPGRIPLSDPEGRKRWERIWGVRISPDPGVGPGRWLSEVEQGNIKALWVMGENPLTGLPQRLRIRSALERLDLLVVQDILETDLSRMADVVLPAAAFSEKHGAFTSMESRIRELQPAAESPGRALPDWEILAGLYDRLASFPGGYGAIDSIRKEIREHVPGYQRLASSPGGAGAWVERGGHETEGAVRFHIPKTSDAGINDQEYPWIVILGGVRNHLGSGTRTGCSRRVRSLGLTGCLEISREDASRLQVVEGETLLVTSKWGSLEQRVQLSDRLGPYLAFLPTGVEQNQALDLLGPLEDPGGWKHLRAGLRKLETQK